MSDSVGARQEVTWRVGRPYERDVVEIRVYRYTIDGDGKAVKAERMDGDGRWQEFAESEIIPPTLTIPGPLLWKLTDDAPQLIPDVKKLTEIIQESILSSSLDQVMAGRLILVPMED